MTALPFPIETLHNLQTRRAAGERVSALAAEVGLPWQKLDKVLRHAVDIAPQVVSRATPKPVGPLTERYRPKCLQAILGQPKALKILETFARSPRPAAFLFEGESGTGKTSAAIGLAAALGCAVEHAEFGGVWTIASGEQSADAVRDKYRRLSLTPMCGSGWKVAIVNEADRMAKPAETIWLDALENLPPRSVVIFTTNFAGNLSSRFRDRCMRVGFVSDAKALREDAERLVLQIWSRETGKSPPGRTVQKIVAASVESGELSFRRVVQHVERELLEGGAL